MAFEGSPVAVGVGGSEVGVSVGGRGVEVAVAATVGGRLEGWSVLTTGVPALTQPASAKIKTLNTSGRVIFLIINPPSIKRPYYNAQGFLAISTATSDRIPSINEIWSGMVPAITLQSL